MQCLYCDRPLALIKRLTGDGEFCSKECRKNYQREHNQLALARLLETQPPKTAGKAAPNKSKAVPSTPILQPRTAKPEERAPEPAGFFTEYPAEAVAQSGSLPYLGSPRFTDPPPPYPESQSGLENERDAHPRTARFQSEPLGPRAFAGELRSTKSLAFKSPPALPAPHSGATARCQPGVAGSVSQQPAARNFSGGPRQSAAPRFRMLAVAEPVGATGLSAVVCGTELRSAKFVPQCAAAQPVPGAIRRLKVEPRWRALQPVLPERVAGKIVFVLGSFLRRPVRTASHDSLPDIFEIPLRPVSFPPFSPVMACLEERMHRTDRIGFSPP